MADRNSLLFAFVVALGLFVVGIDMLALSAHWMPSVCVMALGPALGFYFVAGIYFCFHRSEYKKLRLPKLESLEDSYGPLELCEIVAHKTILLEVSEADNSNLYCLMDLNEAGTMAMYFLIENPRSHIWLPRNTDNPKGVWRKYTGDILEPSGRFVCARCHVPWIDDFGIIETNFEQIVAELKRNA